MRPLTRSCFLLLFLGRLSLFDFPLLLKFCFPSLWSPHFSLHALALIPSSLAKVRLSLSWTLCHLTMWCFEQTTLLLFLLAKAALACLPTALFVVPKPLFPFQQPHYAQVFPLNPAPFCKLFAGLATPTSVPLLCCSYLALALSSLPYLLLPSFFLPQTLWKIWQELSSLSPPVLSGYNSSPDTHFSRGTTWLMSWPGGERYSCPLELLVDPLFLSLVSTLLFSRTGGVLSHRNSSTHRFSRFPLSNLCFLVSLTVFSLVFAATDTAYC